MTDNVISFPLFGRDGFINPGAMRLSRWFWDSGTQSFRQKQDAQFDGGWRWYESDLETDCFGIYNKTLNPMAMHLLPHRDIENSLNGPEFVLLVAKSYVILEHNLVTLQIDVMDALRAQFRRARREIIDEIRGTVRTGRPGHL